MPLNTNNPPQRNSCCCLDSRTGTIAANAFIVLFNIVFLSLGIWDLDSRGYTKSQIYTSLSLSILYVLCASVGLWGAFTYTRWAVIVSLTMLVVGYVYSITIFFVDLFRDNIFNPFAVSYLVVSILFFWLPQYHFVKDLSSGAVQRPTTASKEEDEPASNVASPSMIP